MTDSMVMRLADEIRVHRYLHPNEPPETFARDLLEVMREPTTAMVKAASPVSIIGRWDAMINAALQEGESQNPTPEEAP